MAIPRKKSSSGFRTTCSFSRAPRIESILPCYDGDTAMSSQNQTTFFISVIIPTYNSATTIQRTLESVFSQTYKGFEIIVVDDGSTDTTREILAPYISQNKIRYIFQENAGCGIARNRGVADSKGDLIALLDADDYWHTEKLARQVEVFKEKPDTVVCYTECYMVDPYAELIWDVQRSFFSKQRSGWILPYLVTNNMLTISSAMVPRSYFDKVHGFCERYDLMMVADLDFWLKLAPYGHFCAITTPLTFYQTRPQISQSQIRENHRQEREVFKLRMKGASLKLKLWYLLGYLRVSFLGWIQSFKIIAVLKKKFIARKYGT